MTPTSRRILVVGGGPAGASAAFWLAQAGFRVTIAERSTDKFTYGQGIDVTGPAIEIVRKMGVYEDVRSRRTGEKGFAILDDAGNVVARLPAAEDEGGKGFTLTQELEIMRGDMTRILAEAAKRLDRVEYRYGCTVMAISQRETHVSATLSDSEEPEDFAAIIGADGMMSKTRKLAFDPDVVKDCYKSIDQYTAFFSLDSQPGDLRDALLQHGTGRRSILIRPIKADSTSKRSSCYIVYTETSPELDETLRTPRSSDKQKEIFARLLDDYPGSLRDRALKGMWAATDFYVAQSAQIKLPTWRNGRVVLSGDAAYAPSPATGQGTALAIVGSYTIAGELARSPDDPVAAFARYEERLREYVANVQKIPGGSTLPRAANPESRFGIRVLRFVFWFIAWTGLYKWINTKSNNKLELPEYEFESVE